MAVEEETNVSDPTPPLAGTVVEAEEEAGAGSTPTTVSPLLALLSNPSLSPHQETTLEVVGTGREEVVDVDVDASGVEQKEVAEEVEGQ